MTGNSINNIIRISDGFTSNGSRSVGISNFINLDSSESLECPFCHKIIALDPLSYVLFSKDNVQLYLKCTSCKNLFIGYTRYNNDNDIYYLYKFSKGNIKKKTFPPEIENISVNFVDIYNQSNFSEQEGLTLICGVGYRKALEFLIKDYLISEYPNKKEEIEKKQLFNCINDYIENNKIKEISKRAIWLGNDETHYIRKWNDKDLNDLKKLIDITVSYISSEILSKEYIDTMPDKKEE